MANAKNKLCVKPFTFSRHRKWAETFHCLKLIDKGAHCVKKMKKIIETKLCSICEQ